MNAPDWEPHLARLLAGDDGRAGGAQVEVTEPDGSTRCWPLARHHRLERTSAGGWLLWLRPLSGDPHGPTHAPTFPHEHARRQGLTFSDVSHDGDILLFHTPAAQTVRIRSARDDLAVRLTAWDTFMLTLPADVELDLDRLEDDSWG